MYISELKFPETRPNRNGLFLIFDIRLPVFKRENESDTKKKIVECHTPGKNNIQCQGSLVVFLFLILDVNCTQYSGKSCKDCVEVSGVSSLYCELGLPV